MSDDDASEGEYEVEYILAARVVEQTLPDARDGDNWEYLVRWYGFAETSDTWEPHSSLETHCQTNIRRFWEHVGIDEEDYDPGYLVRAKGSWIKQQHELLAKEKKREARKRKAKAKSEDDDSDVEIAPTPRRILTPEQPIKVKKEGEKRGRAKSKEDGSRERARSIRRKQAQLREEAAEKRKARDQPSRGRSTERSTETKPTAKGHSAIKRSESRKPQQKRQVVESDDSDMDDVPLAQIARGKAKSSNQPKVTKPVVPTPKKEGKPQIRPTSRASSLDSLFDSPKATKAKRTGGDPRRGIKLMDTPVYDPIDSSTKSNKRRIFEKASGQGSAATVNKKPSLPNFTKLSLQNTSSPTTPQETTPVQADQSMEVDHDAQLSHPVEDEMPLDPPEVPVLSSDADSFLKNIPIPWVHCVNWGGVAYENILRSISATTDQRKGSASGFGSMPKMTRKWTWYGECLINAPHQRRCCDVAIMEEPESITSKGLQLGFMLKPAVEGHPQGALHLQKVVPCSQATLHLQAYASRSQLVRIGPKDNMDGPSLMQLATYMLRSGSVSIVPLILVGDTQGKMDEILGIMIVFPPGNTALCKSLKITHKIPESPWGNAQDTGRQNTYLLGAVYPNKLIDSRYMDIKAPMVVRKYPNHSPPESSNPAEVPSKFLRMKYADYYRAHLLLRFPQRLVDQFNRKERKPTYCAWTPYEHDPLSMPTPDLETRALKLIMRSHEVHNMGFKKDVDFIFVHVGALQSMWRLPALLERRSKRPEISFMLYGTHLSVPPKRWGIRDFWSMGGVITFTPSVIARHPTEVAEMMKKAHNNPLWLCCLVPSALGAAISSSDPASDTLDSEILKLTAHHDLVDILTKIEERMVSVFKLPNRVGFATDITHEDDLTWIHEQLQSQDRDTEGLLDFCLQNYNRIPKTVQRNPEMLEKAIRYDITNHMRDLQTRPPLMKSYRRFVVIGQAEESAFYAQPNWCEFATLYDFKGRDELWNPAKVGETSAPKSAAAEPSSNATKSAPDGLDPKPGVQDASPFDPKAQQQNPWQTNWS